ncbi:MAG: AbrB/MazE/SpoVT family DNA-binding domain-containing protein [Candidatus Geothermarchaeales archaeon]
METSTVSDKGLTTIPKKIRRAFSLKRGDKLEWIITEKGEEKTIHVRVIRDPYRFLRGRRKDESLTYAKVEHEADSIVLGRVRP